MKYLGTLPNYWVVTIFFFEQEETRNSPRVDTPQPTVLCEEQMNQLLHALTTFAGMSNKSYDK